ncbi:MAG: ABC transporter ATP-binding protein [Oscillospiraceae bacterium]|nr:ABC transporter ATP-binding protein [Oscillospiraceae bacterium]
MSDTVLEIEDLHVEFRTDRATVKAVNGLSLKLNAGETLGIVGETGSGKSTVALSILRLLPKRVGFITRGSIKLNGRDITQIPEKEMRLIRGALASMIFQDPMNSLNPVISVGSQIREMLTLHQGGGRRGKRRADPEVDALMEMVGIPAERKDEYPFQFSGGMRQRVGIAMALANKPALVIADEPTTALDVTIQAQVLEMMGELKSQLNTAMLLITHDLGIVASMCDKVVIMYAGETVESGTLEQVFSNPSHPYTRGLMNSIPNIEKKVDRLSPIEGMVPDPARLPPGCKFHPRCPHCMEQCKRADVPLLFQEGHGVKCLLKGNLPHAR